MKNYKSSIFYSLMLLAIATLMTSCEGNTDRDWIIKNNSSTKIDVTATLVFNSSTVSETIDSDISKTLTITNQLGGSERAQLPDEAFSSFIITNENGDTFKKDFALPENWMTTIEQVKKVPSLYEHEYILEVNDEDF